MNDLTDNLRALMARLGIAGEVGDVRRLSGGANLESWYFACGGGGFVMRRAPSAEWMKERQIDLATEAEVIRRAYAGGVLAPEVVGDLEPRDDLGIGFVMRAIAGTADPKTIIAEAAPDMIGDIATALARIHALDPSGLDLPELDPAAGVARLTEQFEFFGGDRPVIALGLHWLRENTPPPLPPKLNHGDLRIGNVMAQHGRITGVLDWELAHLGDPHEDLAFGCMTVWRFGSDQPAFGIASLEEFFAAYGTAGGAPVDQDRFRWWLVYRTVWWALGCLRMGHYWREGTDRSLERVVVGRRASEQELDLLLILDDAADAIITESAPAEPVGEPTADEILTAISEWLAGSIKPLVEGRERFNLAVAQNALGIVRRELTGRPTVADRALAHAILTNGADAPTRTKLRATTLAALAADSPKYPSLATARARWQQD